METYYARFWVKNEETGFVEQREDYISAKGKNAHKKVAGIVCKKYNIKHEAIIEISYC